MLCERYKTEDIELALTRLDVDVTLMRNAGPGNDIRELRQRLENELVDYFTAFRVSDDLMAQSPWLTYLINDVFSSGDVAVSLNYDCVLEGALDHRGKWSPRGGYGSSLNNPLISEDGMPKSSVTVLKIHGSANFVIAPYADKPTAKALGYDINEWFFPRSGKNKSLSYGAGTGMSYIIAPSYVKIPAVEIAYAMLDAIEATTKAKNLVIIGSALRPEDSFLKLIITNFLREPSWRRRKIVIVDPSANSISNHLKTYWGANVEKQIVPIEDRLEVSIEHLIKSIDD